ncbi:MAG: hypothetical protein JXQ67_00105 [Campylobacterales bacterium]|nr:hypothetical protein [Campylobacterales bacterium]
MYKLLTSNFNTKDTREIRQLVLLNLLTLVAGAGSAFFAFFNLTVTQTPIIAFMNSLGVLFSVIVFLDLRLNKNLKRACRIAVFSVTIFFIVFVYFNQNQDYGFFGSFLFLSLLLDSLELKKVFTIYYPTSYLSCSLLIKVSVNGMKDIGAM